MIFYQTPVSSEIFSTINCFLNISWQQEAFPDKHMIAYTTAVFKNDYKSLFTNYKPILVLPRFSKLKERIMYNRLYEIVIKNEILYEKQFRLQDAHTRISTGILWTIYKKQQICWIWWKTSLKQLIKNSSIFWDSVLWSKLSLNADKTKYILFSWVKR